jgi:hypothetical protein
MCVGLDRWAVPTPKVKLTDLKLKLLGLTDGDIDAMINDAEAQAQSYL